MSGAKKLRVVVLARSEQFETWEAQALQQVMALPFAEIVLLVRDATPVVQEKSFIQKLLQYKWNRLFWNRWFRKYGQVEATALVNLPNEANHIPVYSVIPELRGKHSQHFSSNDLDKIKSFSPDVILRFGFNILRGEVLTAAKYGVWSFHHADPRVIRGGPASFWEYVLRRKTTGAVLQQLTDKLDDGVILRSGAHALRLHSFRANLNELLTATTGWIANVLTEIHLTGNLAGVPGPVNGNSKVPIYSYPSNIRMVQFWLILLGNKINFHFTNLFAPETWMVGIVDQSYQDVLANGIAKTPKWIKSNSSSHYLADPFSLVHDGERIILAEEYSYVSRLGKIVNLESGATILERAFHLSFPFPIMINGSNYILAEASSSHQLSAFSLQIGDKDIPILNEPIVDPVIINHNGFWWLFCHKADDQNNESLFIYYAETIDGTYTPHALNPVKTDIRSSRSAGPIVLINGKLIRPSQDSSNGYGSGIVVNEIDMLTPHQFAEHEINYLAPNDQWEYNKGMHTVSPLGENQTLIDAKSFRFNFANLKWEIIRKLRKVTGS